MNLGRVLVVAAHYDDEAIGAGGVLTSSDEATVLVLCDPWMKDEYQTESHRLSLAAVRWAESAGIRYLHGHKRDEKLELRESIDLIESAIAEVQPDTVIGHWRGDMNQDHRVAAKALAIAARPSRCEVTRTLAMEIPSSSNVGSQDIGHHGLYVEFLWAGKEAMLRGYAHVLTGDRSPSVLHALAVLRGSVINARCAEFYRVLWEVSR